MVRASARLAGAHRASIPTEFRLADLTPAKTTPTRAAAACAPIRAHRRQARGNFRRGGDRRPAHTHTPAPGPRPCARSVALYWGFGLLARNAPMAGRPDRSEPCVASTAHDSSRNRSIISVDRHLPRGAPAGALSKPQLPGERSLFSGTTQLQ